MKEILFILAFVIPLYGMTQAADDFSDGNFTENPSWAGDSESFEVNSARQLHLCATGADTAVLTLQNTMITKTE